MEWFYNLFNIYLLGAHGSRTADKLAKMENDRAFRLKFIQYIQDAMRRYHIDGLTDTMDERTILQSLLWYGSVVFMEKEGNLISLAGAPSGKGFNCYGRPASAWVYSKNGTFNEEIDLYLPGREQSTFLGKTNTQRVVGKAYQGVIVYESETMTSFVQQVMYYAQIVADTFRTLDVCRAHLKNPYIIACEESIIPSVKKYFKDRDNNLEYVISSGVFPADKVAVLPLQTTPEALKSATELIEWYESKFHELCGFDSNPQIDKKGENLIEAEVTQNADFTRVRKDTFMSVIQRGLDDVNKCYGTSLKVVKGTRDDIIGEEEEEDMIDEERDTSEEV